MRGLNAKLRFVCVNLILLPLTLAPWPSQINKRTCRRAAQLDWLGRGEAWSARARLPLAQWMQPRPGRHPAYSHLSRQSSHPTPMGRGVPHPPTRHCPCVVLQSQGKRGGVSPLPRPPPSDRPGPAVPKHAVRLRGGLWRPRWASQRPGQWRWAHPPLFVQVGTWGWQPEQRSSAEAGRVFGVGPSPLPGPLEGAGLGRRGPSTPTSPGP